LREKKGEFYEAIQKKLIHKKDITTKDELMRLIYAKELKVSEARNYTTFKLFKAFPIINYKDQDFDDINKIILIYSRIKNLELKTKDNDARYSTKKLGFALRYGKYAITSVIFKLNFNNSDIESTMQEVKSKWLNFENYIKTLPHNSDYFGGEDQNFDNYYKGKTINKDLVEFFKYGN
jgi:hypothetical protein